MKKLSFEDIREEVNEFNAIQIHNECIIDIDVELTKPPIALSCGSGYDGDIPLVTYGNFVCLVGASKSYKSFLKSALLACYIGGKSQNYFSDIKGHDSQGKYVIDIDTEQGEYHVQKITRRVINMVGARYDKYVSFALRSKTPEERVKFIDWLLSESEYKNKIGLLSIDGAADLLNNVNDLEKSNEITQKLMSWSKDYNCAVITVLHRNFDTNKPTGHLGSAILKKAETVIFVNKDNDIAEAKAKYTRNMPFEDFSFKVNDKGLPEQVDNIF